MTLSATLPKTARVAPPRPWVAIAIRSTPRSPASSKIASATFRSVSITLSTRRAQPARRPAASPQIGLRAPPGLLDDLSRPREGRREGQRGGVGNERNHAEKHQLRPAPALARQQVAIQGGLRQLGAVERHQDPAERGRRPDVHARLLGRGMDEQDGVPSLAHHVVGHAPDPGTQDGSARVGRHDRDVEVGRCAPARQDLVHMALQDLHLRGPARRPGHARGHLP